MNGTIGSRSAKRKYNERKQKEDYERLIGDAQEMLNHIKVSLEDHEVQSSREAGNWGFNGDLGHVNNELAQLAGFISGDEELGDGGYRVWKSRNES